MNTARKQTWFLSWVGLGWWAFAMLPTDAAQPKVASTTEPNTLAATQRDSLIFLEKQKMAAPEKTLPSKTLAIAHSFLGTPYVGGTLDQNPTEQLVVNLRQLDCWTLMENCLAIAQTGQGDFAAYQSHLRQLRYRDGQVDGYGSRLHYFSEWLLQAEKNRHLRDLTKEMGGIPNKKTIGYITARPTQYPQIKNAKVLREIKAAEQRINAHDWYFIPQSKVAAMEHLLKDGDLIMLTSAKPDLDIAHQGFAVRKNGRVHLLHASSLAKKVIVSGQPLPQYVISQKGQVGIMVARLND